MFSRFFVAVFFVLSTASTLPAEIIPVTLLQINDLYEITPLSGGSEGGLARVATIRNQLFARNPRTYTLIAGDFFSPSAIGTAKVDGAPLAGRQMVDILNHLPLAFATFGNHEFDLKEDQFRQRVDESHFIWFTSNVRDSTGALFPRVRDTYVLVAKGAGGGEVRIGFLGVTLASNPKDYVRYLDPIESAKQAAAALRPNVDIIVALTHLAISDDQRLAVEVPEIDLILGGHEHENILQYRGSDFTPIFKADANVRSVYVHEIGYDTEKKSFHHHSEMRRVDQSVPEDPEIAARVNAWVERAYRAFADQGFDAHAVVATIKESLDGRESAVRNRPTNLTNLIARAILHAVQGADVAVFNSGSIRIDDQVPPGEITQYDIIRILPFGGNILAVDMEGELLGRVLDQGVANKEKGGFLQTANVTGGPGHWLIAGAPLDPRKVYKVATTDFLMTGKEQGLEFLKSDHPQVKGIVEDGDIRFAVIRELQKSASQP